ncbi:hypothetical protein JKP88DRAFT_346949 [Tribonema minus]|uniref:Uncharacterized protein n=1 Tax=Tribonema minus TaxID=303371 RepID=A0A835YL49_9STRA|nr:hypothetical protein JKP88DRAFT_346949 [Tribonema minus]
MPADQNNKHMRRMVKSNGFGRLQHRLLQSKETVKKGVLRGLARYLLIAALLFAPFFAVCEKFSPIELSSPPAIELHIPSAAAKDLGSLTIPQVSVKINSLKASARHVARTGESQLTLSSTAAAGAAALLLEPAVATVAAVATGLSETVVARAKLQKMRKGGGKRPPPSS